MTAKRVRRIIVATGTLLSGVSALPVAIEVSGGSVHLGIPLAVFAWCSFGAAFAPLLAAWWGEVADPSQ